MLTRPLPASRTYLRSRGAVVFLIIALAAAMHALPFAMYDPGDAHSYLIPWYEHILSSGRIAAFSIPFANYTPPYLYLLSASTLLDGLVEPVTTFKLLAWVGGVWLAIALYDLFRAAGSSWPLPGAVGTLLLPSVILNVSL